MTKVLPPLHGCFGNFITPLKNYCFLILLILFSVRGNAAVVLGSTTPGTISNSNTATISHTTASGSDRLMIVSVSAQQPGQTVSSIKYNNINLTKLGSIFGSQSRVEVWYLVAPSVGTFNVVVSLSGNDNAVVGIQNYTGVNQGTPLGTFASATGSGTTATVNASSATNDLVYGVVGFNNADIDLAPGSGQTEYWDQTVNSSIAGAGSTKAGAASVTMSWTSTSAIWSIGAVSIKSSVAASSPGGVSTNLTMWFKADMDATSSQWNDQKSALHQTQAISANRPVLTNNAVNFNPAFTFDGVNDFFSNTALPVQPNSEDYYVVAKPDTVAGDHDLLGFGNSGTSNSEKEFRFSDNKLQYGAYNTTWASIISASTTNGLWQIADVNRLSGAANLNYNGLQVATGTISQAPTNINQLNIGARRFSGANDQFFNGQIPEVIIYSTPLTAADRLKVQSYLAIKYSITLDQTTAKNYVASDGTTVYWNATTNSAYKNNIAGIARDDDSALNQKQSESVNSGLQVVIGNGNTIAADNVSNTNNFSADNSALVWGDNAGSVAAWTTTGAPSSRQIVARTWKVQETGTVGSVKVQVADNSASGIPAEVTAVYLLVDTDSVFTSGATQIVMTLNGSNWEANVDFAMEKFFTFATQVPTAPGGVAANNTLWLKADAGTSSTVDGATVTTWTNSASGAEVSTAAVGLRPIYRSTSSNYNFNPLLDFDGVDDYFAATSNFGVTGTSLFTSFAVSRRATDASNDMFFGGNAAANNNFGFFIHSNDLGLLEATNFGTKAGANATALAGVGTIKGVNRSASNTWQLYHNGAADGASGVIGTFAGTLATSNLNIGVGEGTQAPFDGEISEIVIHSGSLTLVEMNRIQSYLAIKYGITLDQTAAQNYTASDGTTIYWNGTSNSTYKNNITGIARDDASALNQKQSKSVNTGLQVVMGNGNTIATTNALNANGFSADKSALIWGDNAGSVASWTATGAPYLRQIVARKWKVQETGTVGSVKVQVADNSGSNGLPAESTTVYLLTDADGDFTAGVTETAMTLNGTNWEVNFNFTTGQYFTFATLNTAPVDLNLTMTVNNSTVVPGGTLQYVLTLNNSGTTTATNVKVRDQLPGGVTYTSHTASTGSYNPATGIWTLPVVVPGIATLTLNVVVQ